MSLLLIEIGLQGLLAGVIGFFLAGLGTKAIVELGLEVPWSPAWGELGGILAAVLAVVLFVTMTFTREILERPPNFSPQQE